MGSFFNVDSPFMNVMNKICDLVLISLVYIILCIPIITIGPATTALYYATVKVVRRERGYLFGEFFRSFKSNFKSGAFITLVLAVLYSIIYIDLSYVNNSNMGSDTFRFIMMGTFYAITIILALTSLYIFPVLSRFTVKGFQLMKTSFFMAIRHLPTTIGIAVVMAVALLVMYILLPISLLFVPAAACLAVSMLMERVFKKYMPEPSETAEEDGADEWYLE